VDGIPAKPRPGSLHHIELWVPDLARATAQWGWLLTRLGYERFQDWPAGRSWRLGDTYIVAEQSPAMSAVAHDRLRPGLNHLAFHAGSREDVDAITGEAPDNGWALLFPDKHPHAGGPGHYAVYLVSGDGFEVELIAADESPRRRITPLTSSRRRITASGAYAQIRMPEWEVRARRAGSFGERRDRTRRTSGSGSASRWDSDMLRT